MKENEYQGKPLGGSIKSEWKLVTLATEHIERATEKAMQFDFGWIPMSLISRLVWKDGQVTDVELPQWFAIKEDF